MKKMSKKIEIFCSVFTIFLAVLSGFNEGLFRVVLIAAILWILWLLAHFYEEKTSNKKGE